MEAEKCKRECCSYQNGIREGLEDSLQGRVDCAKDSSAEFDAEMVFTVIAAQAQSMINTVQLLDELRFELWAETVMTAKYLNNLVIVTLNGEKKT